MAQVLAGQAVVEGVLMFFQRRWAVAVQTRDGIVVKRGSVPMNFLSRIPFVRGVVLLLTQLIIGTRAMSFAAQESDDEGDIGTGALIWAFTLSLVLALALFKFLPFILAGLIADRTQTALFNVLDGVFRILIFIGYLSLLSRFADIKRLFSYHGAEHKVINAYESTGKLSLVASRAASRFHARCSTSFVVLVLIIAVMIFALVPLSLPTWQVLLVRLALLFPIAGISYELVRLIAIAPDHPLLRPFLWPGHLVQRITTNEPDDAQLRVALRAARLVVKS